MYNCGSFVYELLKIIIVPLIVKNKQCLRYTIHVKYVILNEYLFTCLIFHLIYSAQLVYQKNNENKKVVSSLKI